MSQLQLWYPVDRWRISQLFGENLVDFYKQMGLKGHNGIDIVTYHGQPLRAPHDGIVMYAGYDTSGGLGIELRTKQRYDYNGQTAYFKTILWHLKTGSLLVKEGDEVKAGDLIGQCDNTGMSTGDHLHFGLKLLDDSFDTLNKDNGYMGAVNPAPVMSGFYAKDKNTVLDLLDKTLNLYREVLAKLWS
jgi:murein DD-endopeptidase MepM/ murein hydrolase activator NlpD